MTQRVLKMNIRSLYRLSLAIESLLDDIVKEDVDEDELLEVLLDAKRLTEILSQELNNIIQLKIEMKCFAVKFYRI